MSVPKASTSELDGALGITPPASGLPMVVMGQCAAGPINTPALFARPVDVASNFVGGRAAESAAYALENFGKHVIVIRTEDAVAHSYGSVDQTDFDGTSVVTVDAADVPFDDFEVVVRFPVGGTIGVDGIKLEWSLDGGRTFSPPTNLGTAVEYVIPTSGGITIEFAAGTIVDDDVLSVLCTAPTWDGDALDDAWDALRDTSHLWEFCQVLGDLDATSAAVVAARLTGFHNVGKHRWALGGYRIPDAGETEEDYLDAFDTEFASFASSDMAICAGAVKQLSSIARRDYRRPFSSAAAALLSSFSEEVDGAIVPEGRLPGVRIRDANGNPDEHDEYIRPGLDDARALVARTWDGETGVYINNPRLISAAGSDFDFVQKRRVMNLARTIVDDFMRRRLSKILLVNKKTGFVRETELQSIEASVNQKLEKFLLAKPKASAARLVLSRTDAILEPPYPLTGSLRMIPLAYPKEIEIEVGWTQVQAG